MVLSSNPGGVDEKRQRKKLQNRINQRARRLRLKKEQHEEPDRRPFSVHRWRLEEYEAPRSTSWKLYSSLHTPGNTHKDETPEEHQISTAISATITPSKLTQWQTPLPADNLLHLIYYNVFWGFFQNKVLLSQLTIALLPGPKPIEVVHQGDLYPMYSIIIPTATDIPACLIPTQSQERLVHCSWIDLIPFPRMRENLITWETSFNHGEFVADLIGCFIDGMVFPPPSSDLDPAAATGSMVLLGAEDDEITASRKGLIIWGEPHRAESWEATPGFLRKWSWAVEGCEELIEYSNRWRMRRGEEPMSFAVGG
ncbi:uncharacterized protein BO80DRAFT_467760 [Aspergillus ibericus CBS 121593]|uniref:BZIP domain-containing protein n=1 Tax=Aspergillus ibericus CBS 121593 TaxID=1448316 RepID=A0A395GRE3_9EURO|nr:hypothetical protein BO80DRAFT_467760 [Aspergillus ibericus CBS 121593]RAK97528.1 hypothetical protein BO80DRAFT_467760 [Aspergillus ibericus CBS 121593]